MSELREVVAKAERIGVIGSPSSTAQIKLDVLATAVHKQLVGTLVFFLFNQEGRENCALGQITEINLRNPWVEDPTMRGLIRQKGRVDPITERQDTHTANMIVGAVFAENMGLFEQGTFGTVAATGTPIYLVDDEVLDAVLFPYMEEIFYLGRVYGARPLLPMWLRHFGKEKGGIGEAYHIGIFGKTGSGKSVLAIMMMLGYARHKNISIFVLDPQGQFSRVFKEDIEIKRIVEKELSRRVEIISLYNLGGVMK